MKFSLKLPGRDQAPSGIRSGSATRSSIVSVWSSVFLVLSLLVMLAAGMAWLEVSSREGGLHQQQIEQAVAGYTAQIAELTHYTTASMRSLVKDPQLVQLLVKNDLEGLQAMEQSLSYLFPAAIRVKLLQPGLVDPDAGMTPPLGYACLEMLSRAESGKQAPAAEIHKYGGADQHIDFVQRVPGPMGRPAGNLLVSYSLPSLQEQLKRLPLTSGYVELQQASPQGDVTVASRGDRALRSDTPLGQQDVPGTRWKLLYWDDGDSTVLTTRVMLTYWGSFGGVLLLVAALMYLLYRRVCRALRQDQVTIIRMFKDLADDNLSREYPVSLKDCKGTIEQLRKMVWDYSTTSAPKPYANVGKSPAAVPKPAVSEAPAPRHEFEALSDPFADEEMLAGFTGSAAAGESALDVVEAPEFDLGGASMTTSQVPTTIFRAYDIRGVVGETLTPAIIQDIGCAIGSEAHEYGQQKIVVARDGRLSGPQLSEALIKGLQQSGRDVIDVGMVPTPLLYFAAHYMGNGCGVMLTGSHNPAEYNGLKVMMRGDTLHEESIQALRTRIESGNLVSGEGGVQSMDVIPSYVERITSDVRLERPLKIVVDCGNGVAGVVAPLLLRALGCEVIELFCDVDGNFPNHHPDPSRPENLIALTRAVSEHGVDLGLAFDGDGDRLGVVDSDGKIIWADRLLMLLARDVLSRHPGAKIIYDVKCSRHMESVIRESGGEPLMWKTGHSFLKAKLKETGAQLAGELSGHIFFSERWFGFDDAMYAAARLLEILSQESGSSSSVFASLPESVSTPELSVNMGEGEHFALMDALLANANFPGAHLVTIDGLRVEFEDGWGLVRASNTMPSLVMRFEAENAEALRRIQDDFRLQLLALSPDLSLPF